MEIALRVGVSDVTIHHTVKTRGLEATLSYRKRPEPRNPVIITGELEARIIALACSELPEVYGPLDASSVDTPGHQTEYHGIRRT